MSTKIKGKTDKVSPILFWVNQLAQLSRRDLLARFRQKDIHLTPEQWSLLVELWKKNGQTPSELAQLTGRDRPSTSRLIESLKKQKLVKRIYNEEDRRAYNVHLTSDGEKIHKLLIPAYAEQLSAATIGLSQAEQNTLTLLLKKMYKNIEKI